MLLLKHRPKIGGMLTGLLILKWLLNEICGEGEPIGWHIRYESLSIRHRFSNWSWTLKWNSKTSNFLADSVAKFSLENCYNLYFDVSNMESIPVIFLFTIFFFFFFCLLAKAVATVVTAKRRLVKTLMLHYVLRLSDITKIVKNHI